MFKKEKQILYYLKYIKKYIEKYKGNEFCKKHNNIFKLELNRLSESLKDKNAIDRLRSYAHGKVFITECPLRFQVLPIQFSNASPKLEVCIGALINEIQKLKKEQCLCQVVLGHFFSWYGVLGTTITILTTWYAFH